MVQDSHCMGEAVRSVSGDTAQWNNAAGRLRLDRYDAACKQLLAYKPLLAYIMQNTMEEYRDCSLEEVVACIDGDVEQGEEPVDPGRVRRPLAFGLRNEDTASDEGDVRYDVLFHARLPRTDGEVGVFVNIEPQRNRSVGYPLVKRALYYCARLISAQRTPGDAAGDYRALEKVCSIWLVMGVPAARCGVAEYAVRESLTAGAPAAHRAEYDLMHVALVHLPRRGGYNGFIEALATLFSVETGVDEKIEVLERQFGTELASEFRGGAGMSAFHFGEWALQEGWEKGMEQGIAISIENLMANMSLTMEQAMAALGVPEEERAFYREQLAERAAPVA